MLLYRAQKQGQLEIWVKVLRTIEDRLYILRVYSDVGSFRNGGEEIKWMQNFGDTRMGELGWRP